MLHGGSRKFFWYVFIFIYFTIKTLWHFNNRIIQINNNVDSFEEAEQYIQKQKEQQQLSSTAKRRSTMKKKKKQSKNTTVPNKLKKRDNCMANRETVSENEREAENLATEQEKTTLANDSLESKQEIQNRMKFMNDMFIDLTDEEIEEFQEIMDEDESETY